MPTDTEFRLTSGARFQIVYGICYINGEEVPQSLRAQNALIDEVLNLRIMLDKAQDNERCARKDMLTLQTNLAELANKMKGERSV